MVADACDCGGYCEMFNFESSEKSHLLVVQILALPFTIEKVVSYGKKKDPKSGCYIYKVYIPISHLGAVYPEISGRNHIYLTSMPRI